MRRFEIFWRNEDDDLELDRQEAGDLLAAITLWQRNYVNNLDISPGRIILISEIIDDDISYLNEQIEFLRKEPQDVGMIQLTRNRDGSIYHRITCPYADPRRIWEWAKDKTPQQIIETASLGVYPCKVCQPLNLVENPSSPWLLYEQ